MSDDHFVARTYLKHFGDIGRNGMLHGFSKKNGKVFPCWPGDVCHEWDGDKNRLLAHAELLGEFRAMIEPHWNASVESILSGTLSYHDKFVVAAYMANLMTCTPTWRRIGVTMHNQQAVGDLSYAKRMKEKHGGQPDLPVEAIEALERGEIAFDTDSDYVKALCTRHLMSYTWVIYNLDWFVLHNDTAHPFVTSDSPVAWEYSGASGDQVRRFLPITPRLCLSVQFERLRHEIKPLSPEALKAGLEQRPQGTISRAACTPVNARHINRSQVQSAEDLVFASQQSEAMERLVLKYANYRLDVEYVERPSGEDDSILRGSRVSVRKVRA